MAIGWGSLHRNTGWGKSAMSNLLLIHIELLALSIQLSDQDPRNKDISCSGLIRDWFMTNAYHLLKLNTVLSPCMYPNCGPLLSLPNVTVLW
jgi:hypothetical protein